MFEKKSKNGDDVELTIDVTVEGIENDIIDDSVEYSEGAAKKAFRSLREEFRERTAEDKAFDKAIYEEKRRLEAAREAAKKKNILRKIKYIDNKISKEELERDEIALKRFREAQQSKIDAARAERSSTLVRENKKPIAKFSRSLHQVFMPTCAWIGVHNNASRVVNMWQTYSKRF